jgi:ribosomal protein S18 acetylase RimI-like enzyme
VRYRIATLADVPLLARMNEHLREDEQSRWALTMEQLENRMRGLLEEGYTAAIFEDDDDVVAYALYRPVEGGIYLRQFFVSREHRRQGVGKAAIQLLMTEIWPPDARITLDVLVQNQRAADFWKALGFSEYAITLERINNTKN